MKQNTQEPLIFPIDKKYEVASLGIFYNPTLGTSPKQNFPKHTLHKIMKVIDNYELSFHF